MLKRCKLLFFFITSFSFHCFAQTANVTEGCVPLEVEFQAPSSTSYFWDFKDGVTADIEKPVNVFSNPGIYDVTFHATPGGPVIGTIQIKVYPDPVLNISATSGCAPFTSEFTNLSVVDAGVPVLNYTWVFGDGQSAQGLTPPTHFYSAIGKYEVSLGITTSFPTCNKTVIFSEAVDVIQGPSALITTTPQNTATCNDTLDVLFANASSGDNPSYAWNFGNGQTSTDVNPPLQRYFKGQYMATLTAFYPGKPSCASVSYMGVNVGRPAAVIIPEKDTVCLEALIKFKTTTPGIYSWNLGPNGAAIDLTMDGIPDIDKDSVMAFFTTAGKQTVSLTVTSFDGLCSDTKSVQIHVDEVTAEIESSDPTFICESPAIRNYTAVSNQADVKYNWIFSHAKPDTLKTVTNKIYSGSDTIYYDVNRQENVRAMVLITSNRTGCSGTASRLDTMWLPNALPMPNVVKGCAPLFVTFSDSSTSFDDIVKWEWIFGDGTKIVKSDKSPSGHQYTTPGEYFAQLVVTTKRGCVDTSYAVLIEVGSDLSSVVNFTSSKTEVCPGESISFNVNPTSPLVDAYHFYADKNRVFHCQDEADVIWSYNHETGPQDVKLMLEYNGCLSVVSKPSLINVKGAIAKIDYTALCSSPLDYSFKDATSCQATPTLTWDFGDGQTSSAEDELHVYAQAGTYKVTLSAQDPASGCSATSDTKTIHALKAKAVIDMDTLICIGTPHSFDGSKSLNAHAQCYSGYTWQFIGVDKRPHTSVNPSPNFTFQEGGDFKAMLIVTDINGCTDTATTNFKIFDMVVKPKANKEWVCTPNEVEFTDESTGDTTLVSFQWNFGDLGTSTVQHPTHNYVTPASGGKYNVTLTVTDELGCQESSVISINYYFPATAIYADPGFNLCLGDSVTIEASDFTAAGSHLNFSWDFGNGETSLLQSNKIKYDAAQSYNVTLNYTEVATGCSGSIAALVQLQEYPQAGMTTPNIMGLEVLCAPQIVHFMDSSQTNFPPLTQEWDFGNGQASADAEFYLTYPKGFYTTRHIVKTSFGCADTVSRTYKVFQTTGDFDIDRNTICKGEEITFTIKDTSDVANFTWAFGDGIVLDNEAPATHQYNFHPPSGETVAKLIVEGFDGICPVERNKPIYIRAVVADFQREDGIDTSICFNDGPYHLANMSTGADTFTWDFGDGQTFPGEHPLTHSYATPGVYDVTLSISNHQWGCVDTITKKAVIYSNPVVEAIGDTACLGTALQLQVVNPVASGSYMWTPSNGLSSDVSTNPTASIPHSQFYTVTQTDINGCTDAMTVPAIVIEPIALQNWDTSIVIGDRINLPLNAPPVYIFSWTPTAGLSCLDCNYPSVQPLEDITYGLRVQDVRGCWDDNYEFSIEVKPETFVKLPTLFTPDGDGANDRLYVKGWGIKDLLEFQVFNRWGQVIYSSQDINEGWDGKFRNVLQNSDMYAYKVKVLTWRNETLTTEGFVNLLH